MRLLRASASLSAAFESAEKSASRLTGLVRKSTAPAFIAFTLDETSAFPVRKIIGRSEPDLDQGLLQMQTVDFGHDQIDNRAARDRRIMRRQEFLRR